MPKFQITFDDGSTIDREAATADEAKRAARTEATQKSGATSRTDARIKVRSVVNLDEQAGATDPRKQNGGR